MKELCSMIVALPHEAKAMLSEMDVVSSTKYRGAKVYEGNFGGRELLLLQSGMGERNAYESTKFLIENFSVTQVISMGYCGALVPELKNGDAVLATSLVSVSSKSRGKEYLVDSDSIARFQKVLANQSFPCSLGKTVMVEDPVLKTVDKKNLFHETQAIAVDMESYAVFQAIEDSSKKIASLALRFVVDELSEELVDTGMFMDSQAGLKPMELAKEVLRHPKILTRLPALGRLAAHARQNMQLASRAIFGVI